MKAGDKVVCIKDNWTVLPHWKAMPSAWPKCGQVYTVRRIEYIPPRGPHKEGWGIWLVGITGDINPHTGIEVGFQARWFRLVSEVGHPPIAAPIAAQIPAPLTAP